MGAVLLHHIPKLYSAITATCEMTTRQTLYSVCAAEIRQKRETKRHNLLSCSCWPVARRVEVESKVILATGTVWMALQERVHWACFQSHCFSSRALLAVTSSCGGTQSRHTHTHTHIEYSFTGRFDEFTLWSLTEVTTGGWGVRFTSSSQLSANDVMSSWSSCSYKMDRHDRKNLRMITRYKTLSEVRTLFGLTLLC